MAKLYSKARIKKDSKSGKRFYTLLDMAIIKHDEAVWNSEIKRNERNKAAIKYISVCGCGMEGCFLYH